MKISTIKNAAVPLSVLCAMFFSLPEKTFAEVEIHSKQIGAAIDFGQIKEGKDDGGDVSDATLTRTGVYLSSSGTYDKKLDIRVTIGGLFWYPLRPKEKTPERLVRFGPGVGEAQGIYSFGNPENPSARLHFGLFNVKYNPDAANLGEYLYRSGTYPGYIWNGGWSYMNSASYLAQGVQFTLPTFGGKVTHDFTLFMERDLEPTGDLSPGYILTVKPTSYLEVSGGAVWSHALSLNPDRLTPKNRLNAYDKRTNKPLSTYDRDVQRRGYAYGDTLIVPTGDSRIGTKDYRGLPYTDSLGNGTPTMYLGYYTFKGFKTMARASLDIGVLLANDRIHPGDFRLYSEIALLGVKNQPFFYDDKTERMPIMGGISIPTFGIFNRLAFEMEYHKSRFPNAVFMVFDRAVPLPYNTSTEDPGIYDLNGPFYDDSTRAVMKKQMKKDDWKWSLYASRKITDGVTLFAQAASDNQRQPTGPEAKPTSQPTSLKPSDWYYIVRLDFGLF